MYFFIAVTFKVVFKGYKKHLGSVDGEGGEERWVGRQHRKGAM
jgi:hypothetical protein